MNEEELEEAVRIAIAELEAGQAEADLSKIEAALQKLGAPNVIADQADDMRLPVH